MPRLQKRLWTTKTDGKADALAAEADALAADAAKEDVADVVDPAVIIV